MTSEQLEAASYDEKVYFDDVSLSEWTQGEELKVISAHIVTHNITCDVGNYSLEAIGVYSGGKLTSVESVEITGHSED